jgi:hypothetical protein
MLFNGWNMNIIDEWKKCEYIDYGGMLLMKYWMWMLNVECEMWICMWWNMYTWFICYEICMWFVYEFVGNF